MIPFLDLKAQYASIKAELDAAVLKVLASGQYVLGDEVASFEREFAAYCGAKHAIAVNTGTSALHLALLAAGVGPGDEVITVPFTFVATRVGHLLRRRAAGLCRRRTRHAHHGPGQAGSCASRRGRRRSCLSISTARWPTWTPSSRSPSATALPIIEDACQAHGAEYRGVRAGSIGLSGCFSFYPGKNLGACGEGGIIVTSDDEQMKTMRMLRDWGQEQRYHHVLKGFNYRMDGIQGAILRVKLRHLENWTEARRRHARHYSSLLAGSAASRRRWRRPTGVTSTISTRSGRATARACRAVCRRKGYRPAFTIPSLSICRRRTPILAIALATFRNRRRLRARSSRSRSTRR